MIGRIVFATALLAASTAAAEPFKSADGKFSIDLPKKPEATTQPLEAGKYKLTMHINTVELADSAILVSYVDYTDDGGMTAAERIKATVDSEVKGQKGTIIGKVGTCDIGKKALCREVVYRAHSEHLDLVKTFRNYLVGRRLYQVALMTLATAQKPDIAKGLFDTFKLD